MRTADIPASIEDMSDLDVADEAPPLRRTRPTPAAAAAAANPSRRYRQGEEPKTLYDKIEAFVSRLSVRDNFWNSICSLIWLPLRTSIGRLQASAAALSRRSLLAGEW